jgi:uncharacterized protein involved in exopolysaccharide biosynthesis
MKTNSNTSNIPEDEIDLRELFATIGRHKSFVILFTLFFTVITVIVAYRMPKYYKTTTVIEVKPKQDDKSGGFSLGDAMGGAGALLGLGGLGGSSSATAQDAAKIAMFRTNKHVIDAVRYDAQFYVAKKFKSVELDEGNCSISISGLLIPDYKKFGMEVAFHPVSRDTFQLSAVSAIPFMSEDLGTFSYDAPIHTEYFDCAIHKNPFGAVPETIVLNGNKHYVFDRIISKNLTAETGGQEKKAKADLPFVTISYLDTLPKRGEQYVRKLLDTYIHQSIGDELEDINISLSSIKQQIREIENRAQASAKQYEAYKSKNAILSPEDQAKVLIENKAATDLKVNSLKRKLSLINRLIRNSQNDRKLNAMASSFAQMGDGISAGLVNRLQEYKAKEENLLQEYTTRHPDVIKLRKSIRSLRHRIRTNLGTLKKTLQEELALLNKEKQSYIKQLKQAPMLETNLAPLSRDYKLYETMYTYLLQKKSSLELKKAEALSRFRTIDPIYTNPAPAKPKKALIAIVGMITAFILAIFIVFFREFLKGEEKPA